MAFPMRLPARWLASAMARLTFMSGVGYVGAAYSVSRFLTRPRRRKIINTPAKFDLNFTDVRLETEDGIRLAGWLTEPESPRGTIVLFHGMRHNRESMLERIRFLHAAGYRCLALDHRAHGESSGKRVSFGWYEARDVRAAARWIEERYPGQPRFALGTSMGAVAVCLAGPECGWNSVVIESSYADLGPAFRRRIGIYYPAWFAQLYPGIIWITQKRLRVRISQICPAAVIGTFVETPKLIVMGGRDVLAPLSDGAELIRAAGNAESALIPNAAHNDVCEKGGKDYQKLILEFLNRSGI